MSKFPVLLGAIEIIAGENDVVQITEGAGTNNGTIAAGTYYLRGDGTTGDFCPALVTALQGAGASTNTYGVTVTTNGTTASWDTNPANVSTKVYIARLTGSDAFRVRWLQTATTFDSASIGFIAEKAGADANPEVSTASPTSVWVSDQCHKDFLPFYEWVQGESILQSGGTVVVKRSEKSSGSSLFLNWVDGRRVNADSNLSDTAATIEEFINTNNDGRPTEIHQQNLAGASVTTLSALSTSTRSGTAWVMGAGSGDMIRPSRTSLGLDLWDLILEFKSA